MATPSRRKRKNRAAAHLLTAVVIVALLVVAGVAYLKETRVPVVENMDIEAGDPMPPPTAFVLDADETALYAVDMEPVDTNIPGVYPIRLTVRNKLCLSQLTVKDAIPPVLQAKPVAVWTGDTPAETDFLAEDTDTKGLTLAFETPPDTATAGQQEVALIVTDRGGNATRVTAPLQVYQPVDPLMVTANTDASTILPQQFVSDVRPEDVALFALQTDITGLDLSQVGTHTLSVALGTSLREVRLVVTAPDTQPPVIEGTLNKSVFLGDTISYRSGITVTDDTDPEPTLEIDSSEVNLRQEGTYNVLYTATDKSGNRVTATGVVTVLNVTREQLDQMADNILADITTEGMTPKEKARAIYTWVRTHVGYVNGTDKNDVLSAAYRAFQYGQGDCYTYYAAAEFLLTRAEIENIAITRIPGTPTRHYWSLVNLGEGWYHFDTTPHKKGGEGFMLTESQAEALTAERGGTYYHYDKSLYPTVVP